SLLGINVPDSRTSGRISLSRILSIHARSRHRVLARCRRTLHRLRRSSLLQPQRKFHRPPRRSPHRILLLPHPPPHRHPLVRRRIPRRLGLGRNLLLLRPRQWPPSPRPPLKLKFPRPRLANWRYRWPRRQPLLPDSSMCALASLPPNP